MRKQLFIDLIGTIQRPNFKEDYFYLIDSDYIINFHMYDTISFGYLKVPNKNKLDTEKDPELFNKFIIVAIDRSKGSFKIADKEGNKKTYEELFEVTENNYNLFNYCNPYNVYKYTEVEIEDKNEI